MDSKAKDEVRKKLKVKWNVWTRQTAATTTWIIHSRASERFGILSVRLLINAFHFYFTYIFLYFNIQLSASFDWSWRGFNAINLTWLDTPPRQSAHSCPSWCSWLPLLLLCCSRSVLTVVSCFLHIVGTRWCDHPCGNMGEKKWGEWGARSNWTQLSCMILKIFECTHRKYRRSP